MNRPDGGLSVADVDRYRRFGWLAPIGVLSEAEAAEVLVELERAESEHPDDLHAEHRNNAHLAFPFLADLAIDARIVDPVSAIVGQQISLWSTVLFIKEPESAAFVSWHQDGFYMNLEPDNFVTAWLALTPSTERTGCVSVIPESHRVRADHHDTFESDNILTRGQTVAGIDETSAVDLVLRPGQMSLHHPWLVHGSRPNRSSERRVGIAFQSYLGGDVRPLGGEHHVLPVRGAPPDDSFTCTTAPSAAADEAGRRCRASANEALASVLYDGARRTRRL